MTEHKAPSELILEPFIFFRDAHFYIVEITREQVLANVELNPGTIRVEDIAGNVIWSLQ